MSPEPSKSAPAKEPEKVFVPSIHFDRLPIRLKVAGESQSVVDFVPELDESGKARVREEAERRARAEAEAAAQRADVDRNKRLEAGIAALVASAQHVRSELTAEIAAMEPELAKLSFAIAARALKTSMEGDPLHLLPAIENAIAKLRAGLDDADVVTVHVAASDVERITAAVGPSYADGKVRIVAEAGYEPGRFEARCDIRRIRHAIASELASIAAELAEDGSHG